MAPIPSNNPGPDLQLIEFCSVITPKWAKLGGLLSTNLKDITAKLTTVHGPDEIYIVKADAEEAIDSLSEKLDYIVSELIATTFHDYATSFVNHYQTGVCVAARDVENKWARGLVLNVSEGRTGDMPPNLDIFFVDHGDMRYDMTLKEVFPLPRHLLDELDFQAIALKLGHIKPSNPKGWTQKVVKFMECILVKVRNGAAATLEVVPLSKIGSTGPGRKLEDGDPICNWYQALIFTDSVHELGETLVLSKLAQFRDEADFYKKKKTLLNDLAAKTEKVIGTKSPGEDGDEDDVDDKDHCQPLRQLGDELEGFDFFGLKN